VPAIAPTAVLSTLSVEPTFLAILGLYGPHKYKSSVGIIIQYSLIFMLSGF
jgi:hypothetical protein